MIGFNALGRMGRLCNQMFQYAALKGIARNTGVDAVGVVVVVVGVVVGVVVVGAVEIGRAHV